MSGGGSTKQVQTTTDQSPWGPQQPFLMQGFNEARRLYGSPEPQYYPGQTVTDTPEATQNAWSAGTQQAGANSALNAMTVGGGFFQADNPMFQGAQGQINNAVGGRDPRQSAVADSLYYRAMGGERGGQNPYFQGMMTNIGNAMRPSIDSAFAGAGRGGSGAHANAFASALSDTGGRLAYQDYGDARNNQLQAANMLLGDFNTQYGQRMQQAGMGQQLYNNERGQQIAAAQDYSPYNFMMNVGQQQEAKQGQYLGDAAARWDFAQNQPAQKLAQYMGLIGNRSYGGQNVSSQPYTSNPMQQGIGTAISGLGALGQFGQAVPGLMKLFG